MPTYENECQECGYIFDTNQNIKDDSVPNCPDCKGKAVRTISSQIGIRFKGPGFYENDYKKKTGNKDD